MAKTLKETLAGLIPKLRDERGKLMKEHGTQKISEVTVAQAFGGMRGVKGMVCDTSLVEPDKGLIIRGYPIMKLTEKLPEEIFWLLITGKLPKADELKLFQKELRAAGKVPEYVWKVLRAMPKSSHPMAMLDTAIMTMENESAFRARYTAGMHKTEYWEPALEDAMRLMGTIHTIAAGVYRIKYKKGALIEPSKKLDWAADYARQLGLPPKKGDTAKMMRLYLTLHCDHEGGNVSANTCHTVGSALSDAFYAVSAGLNGLAGPLHGLANQECLGWVLKTMERFGGAPTDEDIRDYAWETLRGGKVIPGYGHAVLRVTDPRFSAFNAFGKKYMKNDPVFQTVDRVFKIVPEVLKEHGKAANPWPNVDAGSGALLYYYGLKEFEYYTVLFSVSRCMGMLAQLVLNRALGTAITRPKSVSTKWLFDQVK
ncbi:MAG: citrate (Si)-synthase [candidate division Zixibacteria bacterium]|nr:citrate (Si)-synthase [candidate division Zixibacteria bacterium]MDH3936268.1 citrate (Si)-synthase [candidate division Zixibacteria bacterium]MDH4034660.1 citrate (Si)-synthase [candidate division Zixibacteria bacterium]